MSSGNDERDAAIRELYAAGWSAIEIADDTGLSRSQVHRIVATAAPDDDDSDDDDFDEAELARLNAMDSGQPVVPPITYVGVETVVTEVKGWDAPQTSREMRYIDSTGRSLSVLDLYRYGQELEQAGKWTEAEELTAALDRQHAEDDELELITDMLGGNPHYEPKGSGANTGIQR